MSLAKALIGLAAVAGGGAIVAALTREDATPGVPAKVGADAPAAEPSVDHGRTAHIEETDKAFELQAKIYGAVLKGVISSVTSPAGGKIAGPYVDQVTNSMANLGDKDLRHFFNIAPNEAMAAAAIALARGYIPKAKDKARKDLAALGLTMSDFVDSAGSEHAMRSALRFLLTKAGGSAVFGKYGSAKVSPFGFGGGVHLTIGEGFRDHMIQGIVILLWGRDALPVYENARKKMRDAKPKDSSSHASAIDAVLAELDHR